MESSYANDNESFKKFLSDFYTNVIADAEECQDLPFRLVSKQLTPEELEAECLEWSIRYLSKNNCPHALTAVISRSVYNAVQNIDVKELKATSDEVKGDGGEGTEIIVEEDDIVLDAHKVLEVVIDLVHEVCKKWKDDLPDLSPNPHVPYTCTHEIKNTRRKMEDRHVSLPDMSALFDLKNSDHKSFFAVFDGHAGVEAATYAAAHIPYRFVKSESFPKDPAEALKDAFKSTDNNFIVKATREKLKSGSTGVLAYIEKNKLHVSWLGDSQALLVKKGRAVKLMSPHKPEREDEQARIEGLGGCILFMGTWRVNGNLSVSRAIGDLPQKKFICSDADAITIDLDGAEDYLILACDGLWDVVDFDASVKLVYDHVQSANGDLSGVAKHLVDTAKESGSSDNITVTVVFFKNDISPPEIPQLFNFGIPESQGKEDSNSESSDKGNNPGQSGKGDNTFNSSNQSDNSSGKGSKDVGHLEDEDQSVFMTSSEHKEGDVELMYRNHLLTRNEPVFIIESSHERHKPHHITASPFKLENQHSTIAGYRQHYDTVSFADLKDFSLKPEKHLQTSSKSDTARFDDIKENVFDSDSSITSGYLLNSNKHSEPYYNKSIFSSHRRKHHKHKNKHTHDVGHNESDTKRSRRHRELSPIVWNFAGSTKPTVSNYKLTYSKVSGSNSTPRFPVHSHGNISETPIFVRKSLPDLSYVDKYRSPRATQDFRHLENGVTPLAQSIDVSNTGSNSSKQETFQHLPKLKFHRSESHQPTTSKFPSTWKPKKPAKNIGGNVSDVPPTPLQNHRLHYDRHS